MIEIRQGTSKDIDQLVVLFEAYRHFYRQQPAQEQATQFLTARLNNKESVIFIAIDQPKNEAVGFTQLYPTYTSTRMKKSWILNDLFVSEKGRGQGISKLLINAAKEHCVATKTFGLLLETERTNIIGNKLYPSAGFTKETSNFYYWVNK
jgi:ribosomal protein S18 acetylase RimI-like enzyme